MATRGRPSKRRPSVVKKERELKAKKKKEKIESIINDIIVEKEERKLKKTVKKKGIPTVAPSDKLTPDEWEMIQRFYVQSIAPKSYNELGKMFGVSLSTIINHFKAIDMNLPEEREKFHQQHTSQEIVMMNRALSELYTKNQIQVTLQSIIALARTPEKIESFVHKMDIKDLDKAVRLWRFVNDRADKIIEHRVIGATQPTREEIKTEYEIIEEIK